MQSPRQPDSFAMNAAMNYVHRKRMPTPELHHQYNFKPPNFGLSSHSLVKKEPNKDNEDRRTNCTYIPHSDGQTDEEHNKNTPNVSEHRAEQREIKKTTPTYQRPSVIQSVFSSKDKDPAQLQFEADMLKFQGSILQHTGENWIFFQRLLKCHHT